jgi:hypothetical protein
MKNRELKVVDDTANSCFEVNRAPFLGKALGTKFQHEGTTYEIRGINRNDGITGHRAVNKPVAFIWRIKKSIRFKQRYAAGFIDGDTSAIHVIKA